MSFKETPLRTAQGLPSLKVDGGVSVSPLRVTMAPLFDMSRGFYLCNQRRGQHF